jgi:hypothetical protein
MRGGGGTCQGEGEGGWGGGGGTCQEHAAVEEMFPFPLVFPAKEYCLFLADIEFMLLKSN